MLLVQIILWYMTQSTGTQAPALCHRVKRTLISPGAPVLSLSLIPCISSQELYHLCITFFTLKYRWDWFGWTLEAFLALKFSLWHLNRSLIVSNYCNVSTGCYLLWGEFSKQSYHGQRALAWGSGTLCPWIGGSDPWLWNCLWTWTFQLPPNCSQKGKSNLNMNSSATLILLLPLLSS